MTIRELALKLGYPDTGTSARRIRNVVRTIPGATLDKTAGRPIAWNIPDSVDLETARRIIEASDNDGGGPPPFVPPPEVTTPPEETPPPSIHGPESAPEETPQMKPSSHSWELILILIALATLMYLSMRPLSQNSSGR